MSSLYFGLNIFCQFDAGVLEFVTVFSVQCTVHRTGKGGGGLCVTFLDSTVDSNWQTQVAQNTMMRKCEISHFLIYGHNYVQYT